MEGEEATGSAARQSLDPEWPEPREHEPRHRHYPRTKRCPHCGSRDIQRSRRRGLLERLFLPVVLRRPFKCERCLHRFYGYSIGPRTIRLALLDLALYVVAGAILWSVSSALMRVIR